ncbi:GntR family transcriptional regulator [Streptomyces albofaciens JCM 4342]|uniref:GntR family transcriptional regulator n=1 Tax=Streptomyces albofaciens TaxID=66866 RepID=UPI001238F1EA|nr:GntR family transcriptional regulator [Streptomyces albofaciens]KAA6213223.1 GntR family transcriptional regulator [Streptomyces albofaciens JCM 4342]
MEQGRAEPAPRLRAQVPAQGGSQPVRGEHTGHEGPGNRPAGHAGHGTAPDAAHEHHSGVPDPATAYIPAPAGPSSAPRRQPQRHSVRGQVLAALREALTAGELVPGEVYSAPALAVRYGVSATPVREAMQLLACEGAVEVAPNRGFRVAERTHRDLAELAEVRAMLEVPALLRLARTLPAERWEDLRPLAAAGVAAAAHGDRTGYADADHAFHHALLTLTGNRQLVQVADDLHRRTRTPVPGSPPSRTADLLAAASEHTALLDALMAREYAIVERIAREHLSPGRRGH